MKAFAVSCLTVLTCVACSSTGDDADTTDKGCASAVVGTWQGTTQSDEITISSNGAFRYAGVDGCVSTGTFACPDKSLTSGTMQVSIASSAGGACLPAGAYVCAFGLNGNAMGYDCTGTGTLQYRRK